MIDNHPVIDCFIDLEGKPELTGPMRQEWRAWLYQFRGQFGDLQFRPVAESISSRQRRWYFGQVLGRITEFSGTSKDDLHIYYKDRFLGSPEHKMVVLVDRHGAIVDERDCVEEKSITVLSRSAMSRYCEDIRNDAALNLQVDIPDADPAKSVHPR